MAEFKQKLNTRTAQFNLIPTNIVLEFKAGVATQADLPLTGNAKGDARIENEFGHLYVWSIDASSGLLTDWVDAGDIVDLNWSAISGKPSSAVADIDNAVSVRHSPNTDTNSIILINEQSDSYILVIGDAGKLIDMNKGSACTLTVPKNSVVAFPIGTTIAVRQKGIGQVTIIPIDGDVTLNYPDGLKIKSQYGIASLLKIAENIWTVIGSLEA